MADRLPFGASASINRPPLFCGLNYQFWKMRMKIFVESLDKGIWDAIENCAFVPKFEKDGSSIEKPCLNGLKLKARRPNSIALLKT